MLHQVAICIKNDEYCIINDEFCIYNDELFINYQAKLVKNGRGVSNYVAIMENLRVGVKMRNYVLKTMNFLLNTRNFSLKQVGDRVGALVDGRNLTFYLNGEHSFDTKFNSLMQNPSFFNTQKTKPFLFFFLQFSRSFRTVFDCLLFHILDIARQDFSLKMINFVLKMLNFSFTGKSCGVATSGLPSDGRSLHFIVDLQGSVDSFRILTDRTTPKTQEDIEHGTLTGIVMHLFILNRKFVILNAKIMIFDTIQVS